MFFSVHFLLLMGSPLPVGVVSQLQPGRVPGQFHCIRFLLGRNQQCSETEDGRVLSSLPEERASQASG